MGTYRSNGYVRKVEFKKLLGQDHLVGEGGACQMPYFVISFTHCTPRCAVHCVAVQRAVTVQYVCVSDSGRGGGDV